MPIVLNCEGEPCPNPVLRCKRLLDQENPENIEIIVDNEAAMDNVSRYLSSKGMRVDDRQKNGNLWTIKASRSGSEGAPHAEEASPSRTGQQAGPTKILVFLTSDTVGQGDDTLGSRLMGNFLNTLPELGDSLWRIIMVNGAVKLATSGSPAIETLKKLEASGVSLLVCGTCLEFFQLMGQKEVGQVTNMLDVVTSQQVADKIISM